MPSLLLGMPPAGRNSLDKCYSRYRTDRRTFYLWYSVECREPLHVNSLQC
jgi:hypothetical protein